MEKSIHSAEHRKLAAVLREMRLEADLWQTDVAKRLDEPQSFVSRYESGERRLDLVELERVVNAMGYTLEELVNRYRSARA